MTAIEARVLYTDGGSIDNGGKHQRARMAVFDSVIDAVVVSRDLGALTNNEAEYSAIEAALDYAARNGFGPVEIRSDSQLCVHQIRGEWKIKEPRLRPYVDRCRAGLAAVGGDITWIRREHNPAGWFLEGARTIRHTTPGHTKGPGG